MASPRDDVVNQIEVQVPIEAPEFSKPVTAAELAGVTEELKPEFEFKPGKHHRWIQRGNAIHCDSCELEHGLFIDALKYRLVGINQETGMPIVIEIDQLEN